MTYETDYFVALFGESYDEAAAIASTESAAVAAKASLLAEATRAAERAALRCPRCMGEGRISQFMHRKGGECFLCGGSGVFSGYRAA